MFRGRTTITLEKELGRLPLSNWLLYFPFRNYVIYKIKDPIRKALEAGKTFKEVMATVIDSARKLPKFNNDNIDHPTSRLIAEKLDKLCDYHNNRLRNEMVRQACKLLKAEHAHDDYYAWFFDYMAVELSLEILSGNYKPKNLKFPAPHCWTGPEIPGRETILKMVKERLKEEQI